MLQDEMYETKQERLVEEDRFSAENVQKLVYQRLNPTPKMARTSSASSQAEEQQWQHRKEQNRMNIERQSGTDHQSQTNPTTSKGEGRNDATRDFVEELGLASATRAAARDIQCVSTCLGHLVHAKSSFANYD